PAVADGSPSPSVTFTCGGGSTPSPSPCSVPVGGMIVVFGNNFSSAFCERSVTLTLINQSTGGGIALGVTIMLCNPTRFRFPSGTGTFSLPTSGPNAVPPGAYRVRARITLSEERPFTVTSVDILTVLSPSVEGTITGTASCNGSPATLLPN